ncbi:Schlafen-like protein 1 [Acipenser ruthenus]|uniref:Schlafen-like protein 1 n=1 Tax=Acipenser ruthenus TaxID=7906 RepID=A0A444V2W8_ACIRT|nr:Schlafen-like protein 1 [Acipenser ruthenus]
MRRSICSSASDIISSAPSPSFTKLVALINDPSASRKKDPRGSKPLSPVTMLPRQSPGPKSAPSFNEAESPTPDAVPPSPDVAPPNSQGAPNPESVPPISESVTPGAWAAPLSTQAELPSLLSSEADPHRNEAGPPSCVAGSPLSLFISNLNQDLPRSALACMLREVLSELDVSLSRQDIEVVKRQKRFLAIIHLQTEQDFQTILQSLESASHRAKQGVLKDLAASGKSLTVRRQKTDSESLQRPSIPCLPQKKLALRSGSDTQESPLGGKGVMGTQSDSSISRQEIVGSKKLFYGEHVGSETRNMEFKRGGGEYLRMGFHHHLRKYACAFLNGEGGSLLVGVDNDGVVRGVECGYRDEDRTRLLVDSALKGFRPQVFPEAYSLSFLPVLKGDSTGLFLKVVRLSVHPPVPQREPVLYETDHGEVYMRRDGSLQGPLKASDIQEWCRQNIASFSSMTLTLHSVLFLFLVSLTRPVLCSQKWSSEVVRLQNHLNCLLQEERALQDELKEQKRVLAELQCGEKTGEEWSQKHSQGETREEASHMEQPTVTSSKICKVM